MCDLETANELHEAVQPHLDGWALKVPEGAVLAYRSEERNRVTVCRSYSAALKNQNALSSDERRGSIIISLTDQVMML